MRKPNFKPSILDLTSGKYYCVFFNSQLSFKYTSKREAERKALSFNKYISDKVQSSNDLLIDIYSIYRRLFFVMPKITSLQIHNLIEATENHIEKVISLSKYNDGCSYSFSNLQNSYNCLQSIASILLSHSQSRKITSDIHSIKSKMKIIELLQKDLYNFEQNTLLELNGATVIELNTKVG